MLVHFDSVAVKLQFGRVQKRFRTCKTGNDFVHSLNEIDYVYHCAVRHCSSYIARNGIGKRRSDVRLRKFFRPSSFSVKNIAETLNKDMTRRKHIGQFSDFLRVSDGLIERVVEVVGNKNGKICVVGFKFLVGVTVDYGKIVVIVFLADKTARILAESANLVLERLRIAYQLRFVKNLIDLFHDLVSDLDAHADVNRAWNMRYIMFRANAFKPFRASSSGCDNGRFCVDFFCFFAVCDIYAVALVAVQDNIRAFITEKHFNAVFEQIFFNRVVKSLCLFSSEVTNGAVNKTQARFYGTASYIFDLFFVAQTLDVRVCTEFKIYLICVIYRFLRKGLTYQRRQISSDFAAEAQFSVGKCARARKTCRYMTIRLAVDAFLRLFFRAMPVLYRLTLFNDDDMLFASLFY